MSEPKKIKNFFAQFPSHLKWGIAGILVFLLGYLLIYKIYQHNVPYKKRVSIPVAEKSVESPAHTPEPSLEPEACVINPEPTAVEESLKSASIEPLPAQKQDLTPLIKVTKASFTYSVLSQKVFFGAAYSQELKSLKLILGRSLDNISLEALEKSQFSGISTFQDLEMELVILIQKKHPSKRDIAVGSTDSPLTWEEKIKAYLASIIQVEKNEPLQKETALQGIHDVFLMLEKRNLKEAIFLMTDLDQRHVLDGTLWISKAQNLQAALTELEALYGVMTMYLEEAQHKISGGPL